MATAGALVGASVAGLAYKLSGQNYTITFALATIPATLALLLTISVSIPSCNLTSSFKMWCDHLFLPFSPRTLLQVFTDRVLLQAFGDSAKAAGAAKKAARGGCSTPKWRPFRELTVL